MKSVNIKQIILVIILALATVLRVWNLGGVPPSASLDEASIGYNAYSVLRTGVDEYGEFPLISQRGYDDWRRSTYLMLVMPFVAIFDLQAFSIRIPAVILSIFTVFATYKITLLLFSKQQDNASIIALLSSLMLAISPWHLYISRLGHESNACLSFLVFGILFFLLGERSKSFRKIIISMTFFTLSMISYYSGQALIPLLGVGLFFIFRKSLLLLIFKNKKNIFASIFFCILLIPLFWSIFSPQALVRFQGTSTFKPESHQELYDRRVILRNEAVENNNIVGAIFYSRHLYPVQVFIEGYIYHFNPTWLFLNPIGDAHKIPNMGLLYIWEIPFIILGFVSLLGSREIGSRNKILIFLWFFIAAVPPAIATQVPHAMRSYNFLPTWQIFTAFGLGYIIFKIKSIKLRVIMYCVVAMFILYSIIKIYENYFIVFPKEQSNSFQYALSKTVPYVISIQDKYTKIVFSNQENLYQSYMLFLFHSRYDPKQYQKQGGTISGGYAETHNFGKYEFRPVDLTKEEIKKGVLYVLNTSEISADLAALKTFKNLDGEDEIIVISR